MRGLGPRRWVGTSDSCVPRGREQDWGLGEAVEKTYDPTRRGVVREMGYLLERLFGV